MDPDVMNGLLIEVVNGTAKSESRYRDLPDFSTAWDALAAEVQGRPGVTEIPTEIE